MKSEIKSGIKSRMVRFTLDLNGPPPPLTEAQKKRLDALKNMPDSEIDYSDIPPLDEKFWKNAVRNPFYKPTKTSTTVRIDSDVLHWLRAQGKGYQSRINAILRREMLTAAKVVTATEGNPPVGTRRPSRQKAAR